MRGLTTDFSNENVTFLTADLSDQLLDLEPETYQSLSRSITHIVHNAWPVDFNIPLSAFNPLFEGIVNLVRFAATASSCPSFFFVSSVSSVSHLEIDRIPEELVNDEFAMIQNGYGASKYIAEHLINHAAKTLHLRL